MTVSEYKMLDHVPIGACVVNPTCEVVYWNKCLEDWTGILRSEIVGSELKTHFPHFDEPKYSGRIEYSEILRAWLQLLCDETSRVRPLFKGYSNNRKLLVYSCKAAA